MLGMTHLAGRPNTGSRAAMPGISSVLSPEGETTEAELIAALETAIEWHEQVVASGPKPAIRHEIDVFDIGDDGIEDFRGRLGAGEFVDDDITHEVGQRQRSSVVAVGCQQVRAAQTGYGQRIENPVAGKILGGEFGEGDVIKIDVDSAKHDFKFEKKSAKGKS